MSVQLLSAKEALDAPDQDGIIPYAGGTTAHEKPGSINNGELDKLVDGALDAHYREDDPEPDGRDLDALITSAMDAAENREADVELFKASREAREELGARYASQGDIGQTLDRFIGWSKHAAQDPAGAGLALAESYVRLSPYSLKELPPAQKAEVYVDPATGNRSDGRVLDEIIELAIDNATAGTRDLRSDGKAAPSAQGAVSGFVL